MNRLVNFAIVFLFASQAAYAGQAAVWYDAGTGDKELDVSLGRVNVEARADMNNFIRKLSVSYNTPDLQPSVFRSRLYIRPVPQAGRGRRLPQLQNIRSARVQAEEEARAQEPSLRSKKAEEPERI